MSAEELFDSASLLPCNNAEALLTVECLVGHPYHSVPTLRNAPVRFSPAVGCHLWSTMPMTTHTHTHVHTFSRVGLSMSQVPRTKSGNEWELGLNFEWMHATIEVVFLG